MNRWLHALSGGIVALICAVTLGAVVQALEVPTAPPLERPIVDTTKTLSEDEIGSLSAKLNQARQTKNIQLGILIIPSLEDRALEEYSLDVARTWGIGERERDNGVLLLIVKDDKRMRIEVGRGQEGDLTDAQSGRIIRNTLAPAFRQNDYYGGIDKATTQIIEAASGNPGAIPQESAPLSSTSDTVSTIFFLILFFLIPLLSWIGAILARSKSWWAGGVLGVIGGAMVLFIFGLGLLTLFSLAFLTLFGLVFDYNVSKNYRKSIHERHVPSWWAGGGFGGFGGGRGGGGFGGGGFGGGGASGSW